MSILCYHTVQPGWRSPLAVEPDVFASHCSWLARRKVVLPLDVAVQNLDRTYRLPRGTTALTFDDGFASLREHALPQLLRYGLPATVFLVAETLTSPPRPVDWVDDPTPGLRTLTTDQVLEMRRAGVTFASHSFAHHDLTTLSEAEVECDLRRSRELLEDLLHEDVRMLAYPRGRHDEIVRRAARSAGYDFAFSLPESAEPVGPHAIPRAGIYPHDRIPSLAFKSARTYLPFRMSRMFPVVRQAVRGRQAHRVTA